MPPFVLALAAAAMAARLIRREWMRVNRALDDLPSTSSKDAPPASTLRRDPASGIWRPT